LRRLAVLLIRSPERRWLLRALMFLGFIHAAAYALMVPPWQAPDEPGHFEHSYLLSTQWRHPLSVQPDPALEAELIASLYANRYWDYVPHARPADMPLRLGQLGTFAGSSRTLGRPSLSYVPYALALVPFRHQDIDAQLRLLRLLSAAYVPLVVWLAWRSAALLFPGAAALPAVAAAFVALLPQHAATMGSVSDGNLAELLASLFFYAVARTARMGMTWRRGLAIGLTAFLSLLCKDTALFLLPTALVGFAVLGLRRRLPWWELATAGLSVGLLTVAGARFGPRINHLQQLRNTWSALFQAGSYSPERLADYWDTAVTAFESFWARFGWLTVRMATPVYQALLALSLLLCVGLVMAATSRRWPADGATRRGLATYVLALAFAVAFVAGASVVYYSPYVSVAAQGRYLFPALLPMSVLAAIGARAWARLHRAAPLAVVAMLGALAVYALAGVAAPAFH